MPTPVPDKELKFIEVIIRHGARSPLVSYSPLSPSGYWFCDGNETYSPRIHAAPVSHFRRFRQIVDEKIVVFPPNCNMGDLTTEGMNQHLLLGKAYNKYLFDNGLFSSLPVDPEEIEVRCTHLERTFRSAESFLHGAFPPKSDNEVIDVIADTKYLSNLRFNAGYCKDVTDMQNQWVSTEEFQRDLDANWTFIKPWADFVGVTEKSLTNLNDLCDYVATHYCSGKPLPEVATEAIQEFCVNWVGNSFYEMLKVNSTVGGSYIMRELLRIPKLVVNESSKVKFSLMSAHDATLAAIMVFLKDQLGRSPMPEFASHLTLELWKGEETDYWIRWTLNGEEIPLREMNNQTLVQFKEFLEAYSDMDKYCTEVP